MLRSMAGLVALFLALVACIASTFILINSNGKGFDFSLVIAIASLISLFYIIFTLCEPHMDKDNNHW